MLKIDRLYMPYLLQVSSASTRYLCGESIAQRIRTVAFRDTWASWRMLLSSRAIETPAPKVAAGERVLLDLGVVKYFAQVTVNGKAYPSMWRPPFVLDITDAVKDDALKLEVRVTNLWPNRLIGDEIECAEDCSWKGNAAFHNARETGIAELPDWVKKGERSPTGRCTFTTWKHWTKDDEPLVSGLLGPVVLRTQREKAK